MKRSDKLSGIKNEVIEVTDKKIWWRNGGGSFHAIIDGRAKIIKPNEKFQAYEHEIPKSFRDAIYTAEPLPSKIPVKVTESVFEAVPSEEDSALFDVVNKESGKVINGHPLEEQDAVELATNLNKK